MGSNSIGHWSKVNGTELKFCVKLHKSPAETLEVLRKFIPAMNTNVSRKAEKMGAMMKGKVLP